MMMGCCQILSHVCVVFVFATFRVCKCYYGACVRAYTAIATHKDRAMVLARQCMQAAVTRHRGPFFLSFDETAWSLCACSILCVLYHFDIAREPWCIATVATTASITADEVYRQVLQCVHDFRLDFRRCTCLMADGAAYVQKAGRMLSQLFFFCFGGEMYRAFRTFVDS